MSHPQLFATLLVNLDPINFVCVWLQALPYHNQESVEDTPTTSGLPIEIRNPCYE